MQAPKPRRTDGRLIHLSIVYELSHCVKNYCSPRLSKKNLRTSDQIQHLDCSVLNRIPCDFSSKLQSALLLYLFAGRAKVDNTAQPATTTT
jgi:hypothetical protein